MVMPLSAVNAVVRTSSVRIWLLCTTNTTLDTTAGKVKVHELRSSIDKAFIGVKRMTVLGVDFRTDMPTKIPSFNVQFQGLRYSPGPAYVSKGVVIVSKHLISVAERAADREASPLRWDHIQLRLSEGTSSSNSRSISPFPLLRNSASLLRHHSYPFAHVFMKCFSYLQFLVQTSKRRNDKHLVATQSDRRSSISTVNDFRNSFALRLACSPATKANRVQPPAWLTPEFSHVGIDAAGLRVFSGISRFPRPYSPRFTPVVSRDPARRRNWRSTRARYWRPTPSPFSSSFIAVGRRNGPSLAPYYSPVFELPLSRCFLAVAMSTPTHVSNMAGCPFTDQIPGDQLARRQNDQWIILLMFARLYVTRFNSVGFSKRHGVSLSDRGRPRIYTCGNRAGRCHWLAGFLGDLQFPCPYIPELFHTYLTPPSLALHEDDSGLPGEARQFVVRSKFVNCDRRLRSRFLSTPAPGNCHAIWRSKGTVAQRRNPVASVLNASAQEAADGLYTTAGALSNTWRARDSVRHETAPFNHFLNVLKD
ncbi:hypothetical protein PR048_025198 [Dryococelus australis]|uniref:Uncharacterized protein n=1 Tax=Dryococelus australis TaxID=614101 RepID=A0ABQ9GQR0_9NEOP|nr:hypothetical protein PR048_025198 [Dryococelus australis]